MWAQARRGRSGPMLDNRRDVGRKYDWQTWEIDENVDDNDLMRIWNDGERMIEGDAHQHSMKDTLYHNPR